MRPFAIVLAAAVVFAALPAAAQVNVKQGEGRIAVEIDGKPFTTLFMGPDAPKPYLHPLRSASGKIVTRSWPMEQVAGESHDHPHHRGLWFSHGDVNGFDFWSNEPPKPTNGKIVLKKVVGVESGAKSGRIAAIFEWLDPKGKAILSESRTMVFSSAPGERIIDFDIELTALQKAVFGDTKEGTFAIRLATPLEEPEPGKPSAGRTGRMVNAEGAATEANVWGKRSPWVDYYGQIGGEKLGIAIFDHPSNPRHPTWWHSRAYGLFAANIFGLHDFEHNNRQDGKLTLEPQGRLHFRYRVLIHPGDVRSAAIAKRYAAWTK